MSFWAGLARGYADADAKKEREAVRAEAEAARKETRDYARGRDAIMDARYDASLATAEKQAEEAAQRWQKTFDQNATTLKEDRAWRQSEAKRTQGNIDRTFEREDKYGERTWALQLDKFSFTKDQAEEAKARADRIFAQGIKAFEYGKSRDVVGDLRKDRAEARAIAAEIYVKERDILNDQKAEQNREDRLKQFEFQVKRAGVSDEQWQASFDLQEDQVETKRMSDLLNLAPGLASALGGGGTPASTSAKGPPPPSGKAMKEFGAVFMAEFENLDEDTKNSDFFKAAASSPGAQATIMTFVQAQAEKSNPIKLADVPKYFKYLGATKGKGEKEAKEFLDSIVSGDESLGDKDTFVKGLMIMRNYKPVEQLFIQTNAPVDVNDATKQIPLWETAVEVDAYRALQNLEGDAKKEVQGALAFLRTKTDRTKGLDILAGQFGFGAKAVEDLNMGENPVIQSYYGTPGPEVSVGGEGGAAGTGGTGGSVQYKGGVTEFKSWDEVAAARENGFTGNATVDGETAYIPPISGPVVGEPVVEEPVVEEPVVEEPVVGGEAFLGTGYVRPASEETDTDIDRLFNEASDLGEAAVEGEPIKRVEPEKLPDVDLKEAVETINETPDSFESPEELEKSVDFVLEEIEEMGITFPTTNTELVEFRADLKELVYEMGAEIPAPVLQEVIRRATDNAKGGLSVTGTLQDASGTGREQGGNPDDTPVGTQLKNFTDRMGVTEPDTKKRKRKPEPAPELNSSEVSRLKRAIASGDEGIFSNLVEKYGEEKIAEVMEGLGL